MNEGREVSAVAPEEGGTAAEELAYRLHQQRLTAEFGHFALKTHDLPALLEEATRLCATGLRSELCKIMEYLPAEHQFIVRAGIGWKAGVVGQERVGADLESPSGYAFQTGQPVISNHLEVETRFRTPKLLSECGVKRAINVLIQGDGDRFGVLEVDSPTEGRFTEADLAFLEGFANLLGVAIDRQRAEEALRENEQLLQRALSHQEVLTQEVSHRVKNSLAMVAGLLRMQGRMSTDAELQQALADAQSRVQTISQLHDRLWREDEVRAVDLADYLGSLCEQLRVSGPAHAITCEIAQVTVAADQAISLGLLANELVTNAFKYAYPGGSGEVRLVLKRAGPEHIRFGVYDRGTGLPSGFDVSTSRSLGMKLIASLAHQLGGHAEWKNMQPGTGFTLDFPHQAATSSGS